MAVRSMIESSLQLRDVKVYANAADLATGDTTTPLQLPNYPDKTVQVSGTFNSATVTIQGSNNGTTYVTLHKPDGTDATFTTDAICQILENPVFIRASAASGTATALTFTICCSTQKG